ncbi:acyl-CoA thioesterase [Aneurinibacillus aneurinilyticus]|nr:thioesterase family protein [Aneurinibacillus aneurinilyticus]MCI1692752.1 acyl-CoA thioesterase [Aneurinibacillus aneurinilyticus]MED0668741.1 thioesterase family protein [Aneurinibacillus aneurinilyticus]MED0708345.1 thioesterase family protein [Aneurinibacillus aneurinilyticus]MED0722067.1 thioesterase family protein [Aneurinibacillus aneurinilyticus]MED0733349.1 thioesterase family protein [Aneurinibacillus aneurinilyticus]
MYATVIQPRMSETNGTGHISNTTLPVWFEAAREPVYRLFNPSGDMRTFPLIIVNMNVDFLRQIYFGWEVEVRIWVKRIGNSSFTLYEELYQEEQLCAKGSATYVYFDYENQKSQPISPEVRQKLEVHRLPTIMEESSHG